MKYDGYYVIDLAEETDGVPMYIALEQDILRFSIPQGHLTATRLLPGNLQ